jgi:putative ubiquitin-RnfH superfamily antitoxin RatB of RatAB toxin-antitoxin module
MARAEAAGTLTVAVACSPADGTAEECRVIVPAGATLIDALRASGVLERHPQIDLACQAVGIWGRIRALDARLKDGDRVELYRPLQVDPKEARRRRQRLQQVDRATCSPRR